MADVTGDLGGQPIQLNNAATEATLKQLLAAMIMMAAKSGKDGATQKKIDAEIRRFAKEVDRATKTLGTNDALGKKLTKAEQDALKRKQEEIKRLDEAKKKQEELQKAQAEYQSRLESTQGVVKLFSNSIDSAGNKIFDLAKDLANMGDNIESAGAMFRELPVFGGLIANAFGAVASAANKTYDTFTQLSAVGANFGGSIQTLQAQLSSTGLTMDQFAGVIKNNAEGLALMGGSVQGGVKRFSALSKEMRSSPLGTELTKLGFTTEQINNGMVGFVGSLAKTGAMRGMSDTQLAASAGNYLKNLDAVSRLTGQTREDLEKQRGERMRDSQMRLLMGKMDADSQANLHALMDTIPKEHAAGLKEIMTTGTATSEEGVKSLAYLRQMGVDAGSFGQSIRSTGKLTKEQMVAFGDNYQRGAAQFAKSGLAETLGKFGEEGDKAFVVAAMDVGARTKTFGQAMEESADAANKAKEAGLSPEDMAKNKQAMTDLSNQFTAILSNSGLLPSLLSAFQTGMEVVGPLLIGTLEFIGNNGTLVGIGLGVVAATLLVFKAALAVSAIAIQLETAKRAGLVGPGSALTKMFGMMGGAVKILFTGLKVLMGPVGLVILGITAVVAGIKYLADQGWTLSDVFTGVKDWWTDLMDTFSGIMDSIRVNLPNSWGGISKDERDRRKAIREDGKKERDDAAKKRQEDRKLRAEKIAAEKASTEVKKENNKATAESTEAKKEEVAAASQSPSSYGSPEALAREFYQQQQRPTMAPKPSGASGAAAPVAPAHSGLGGMAAAFESGKAGTSAVGFDSTGGTSFGKYQIATRTGTMDKFMEHLKKTNPEAFDRLTKAGPADSGKDGAFAQEWKKLSGEGKLAGSEHDFIKKTHYDVGVSKVKDKNLQGMIGNSKALQEVMFSTSVQHGGGGAGGIFNKSYKEGMSEQDLIKAIYAERGTRFGSSTAGVRQSVQDRFGKEQQLALGLVGQPGVPTAAPSQQTAQTAVAAVVPEAMPAAQQSAAASSTPAAAKPAQESAESLLASLNNKMDQLISISAKTSNTNERQLKSSEAMIGDLFIAA